MLLQDQCCIVTGGAAGIGWALSEELVRAGARVVLADIDRQALERATATLGGSRSLGVACDVGDPAQIEALADRATEIFGTPAVWVNNAGIARHRPVTDYAPAEIDRMIHVNLKGTIFGCQTALRRMRPARRGQILNVISTASLRGIPTESVYCATKWAVRGFTQALQEEAAPWGIRVIALLPGGVDTVFWDAARPDRAAPREKFLTPAQVARAAAGLLQMEDAVAPRELVLRSPQDTDFSVGA